MSRNADGGIHFPPPPRNKAELLEQVRPHRAELEQTVSALSEAELITPGLDGWSVKDHMTHLAA